MSSTNTPQEFIQQLTKTIEDTKSQMARSDLQSRIKAEAIRHGDFTLKSGAKSSYYIDLRRVTLHSKGLQLIVDAIMYKIGSSLFTDVSAIGGPCIGADPIVGGILYANENHPKNTGQYKLGGFLVRKEQKDHGIDGLIIGSVEPKDKVIIVEDVTTSGGSLLRACEIVQEFGCTVMEVISVVDRNAGAKDLFEEHNIPFSSLFDIEELL